MNHLLISLISLLALLISLTTHEYCHALMAYLLGDDTAKRMGRLTLNPLAHIDPIGTILIPLIGALSGLPIIGWAKPVPFNPYNLRSQKWGATMVALAGPFSNFLGAFIYILLLKLVLTVFQLPIDNLLSLFLALLVIVNVVLGVFNFIPVPPLDGSKLVNAIFDAPKYQRFRLFLETRGSTILLAIILIDFISPVPILGSLFNVAINLVFSLAGLHYILGVL